jgi:translation initiation factor IF-2
VHPDSITATTKASEFEAFRSSKSIHNFEAAGLDALVGRLKAGNLKQLKIVLKTDSNGSLEALRNALLKLSTAETKVSIIHAGVGEVNDSDVLMAGTSQALLIGFNVGVLPGAKHALAQSKIEYIDKKVIYHVLERIEAIITGMVDLKHEEVELGMAKLLKIFYTSKDRMILGLSVESGIIENKAKLRIIRNGKKVGMGEVSNLKQ